MLKAAIIGMGGIGNVHYKAYKTLDNVRVVAVADIRKDVAKEKIGEDEVNIYSTIDELLANEQVDVVDVCLPSYMHADAAVYAMERGCHVLCEKPMSNTPEEAKRILDAKYRTGKLLMIAHVVRFMAPYAYLREIIKSGELGKPVFGEFKRYSKTPNWSWENWELDLSKGGGSPIDLAIHDFDYVLNVFGEPNKTLTASNVEVGETNYIDSILVYDGFSVRVSGGFYNLEGSVYPFRPDFTVMFERGYVENISGKLMKNGEEVDLNLTNANEDTGINLKGANGYAEEIRYFTECIEKGEEPSFITPESALRVVEFVTEQVKTSAKV